MFSRSSDCGVIQQSAGSLSKTPEDPRVLPTDGTFAEVDVAIVMESTYPFLKGGVSAVVHDLVTENQDLTFGIIHIAWDSSSARQDLYGMPANVKWIRMIYLSMQEHLEEFVRVRPNALGMGAGARARLADSVFDALEAVLAGDNEPMLRLYDEGALDRTVRSFYSPSTICMFGTQLTPSLIGAWR